jgi:hypothetical protein
MERPMRKFLASLLIIFHGTIAQAAILYSQAPDFDNLGGSPSFIFPAQTADNFSAADDWLVDSITFQGAWTVGSGALLPNQTTRTFRIDFYDDDQGAPASQPLQQLHLLALLSNPRSYFDQYMDLRPFCDYTVASETTC